MAMSLDFSGALQSMINDKSSDSKTNRRMVKTLYGDEIIALREKLVQAYEDAVIRTAALVKDGKMNPEQAQHIVSHYKSAMDDGAQFAHEFLAE